MMRFAPILTLLLGSCRAVEPEVATVDAAPDRVRAAVLAALSDRGDVEEDGPELSTYWRSDPAVRDLWTRFGHVLEAQSRYHVTVREREIRISARARVLVYYGTRRRNWEEFEAKSLERKLLDQIRSKLE